MKILVPLKPFLVVGIAKHIQISENSENQVSKISKNGENKVCQISEISENSKTRVTQNKNPRRKIST